MDCIPCILKQAVNLLSVCDSDKEIKKRAFSKIIKDLDKVDFSLSPAKNSDYIYKIVSEYTGIKDPFYDQKKLSNKQAMEAFPDLKKMVEDSDDKLLSSIKIAIAGNAIDLGINFSLKHKLKPEEILKEIEGLEFGINDYDSFKNELSRSKKVLYMADNAGEIVFDRVLIEEITKLGKEVILAVKSGPIINDANIEDTIDAGFGKDIEIVETGCSKIGMDLDCFSEVFKKIFKDSDLIICKGQAHFESFDNYHGPIFFLLKCKCSVIAEELKTEVSKIALYKSENFRHNDGK